MAVHGCNFTNCSAEVLHSSPAPPSACDGTPRLSVESARVHSKGEAQCTLASWF